MLCIFDIKNEGSSKASRAPSVRQGKKAEREEKQIEQNNSWSFVGRRTNNNLGSFQSMYIPQTSKRWKTLFKHFFLNDKEQQDAGGLSLIVIFWPWIYGRLWIYASILMMNNTHVAWKMDHIIRKIMWSYEPKTYAFHSFIDKLWICFHSYSKIANFTQLYGYILVCPHARSFEAQIHWRHQFLVTSRMITW